MSLTQAVVFEGDLDTTWIKHSACHGLDPKLFWPEAVSGSLPKDHDPVEDPRRLADVQDHIKTKYCTRCVVKPACAEYAIITHQQSGVWGGMNEFELRKAVKVHIRRHER